MFTSLKKQICSALLGLSTLGTFATPAMADHCPPGYRIEWKVRYENRRESYVVREVRYDHCNNPYWVNVTKWRVVSVPVWFKVFVPLYGY
jgi:hypothetical protein